MNARRAKYIASYLTKAALYKLPNWGAEVRDKLVITPQEVMLADRAWKNHVKLQPVAQNGTDIRPTA